MNKFTDADITSFIKELIQLGGVYSVEESPDKYIVATATGKVVTLPVDGHHKSIACYGTAASDAIVINPFSEGDAESVKNSWFMHSLNTTLSGLLVATLTKIINVGVAAHKKTKDDKSEMDFKAIKLISKHVNDVDDKMLKELKTISSDLQSFFTIKYNKSARQGELKCLPFITAQRKAYSTIRVKTWDVLTGIISDILGTEDLADFNFRPDSSGFPVFESFVNILVSVYERINESLEIIDRKQNSLVSLRVHLKYLMQYSSRAVWCASPSTVAPVVQPQQLLMPGQAPWTVPSMVAPPTNIPLPGTSGYIPQGVAVPMQMGTPQMMMTAAPMMQAPAFIPQGVSMPMVTNTAVPMMTGQIGSSNPTTSTSSNPFARP